jgi:hypothetical protein
LSGFWAELLSFYGYATENLECIMYGIELLAVNFSFLWAFFDLLVDISESFGILAAISVILAAYTTILFTIHHVSDLVSSKSVSLSNGISVKLIELYNRFKSRF